MIEAYLSDKTGHITLNRPETHNALDRDAMQEIIRILADWRSTDIRALVITGKGRSFCSGASLGDVANEDWSNNPITEMCDAIEAFPAPSICALNGGVYGGGVELAIACDFRIGVNGMKMFVPPAKLGIHYEPAGISRLMQRLGAQTARRAFLLAENFDDNALLACGFLDYLVTPQELEEKTQEITGTITGLAPMAVQGMKRTIVELSKNTLDTNAARQRVALCFASSDHAEGLLAMKEKRKPLFKGK